MIQTLPWWVFLAGLPALYWLAPVEWRTWILTAASLVLLSLYAFWDLTLMVALGAFIYAAFRIDPETAPRPLAAMAGTTWPAWIVLSYFGVFKYVPELAAAVSGDGGPFALAVPLGVSYFSFKLLHYAIEMRRGGLAPHGPGDFASWLFLAPIFTAGPIERFDHYMAHREAQSFESRFLVEGSLRIAIGLVKKFVFGVLVLEMLVRLSGGGLAALSADPGSIPVWQLWGVLLLTLAFIYFDFSAYSDIAIGSSRLFGLTIMENFNFPFLATSLQNFWQRWHMSLAHWCRSYIYMGMIGFTRNPYRAVLATFVVMGLWHSASPHWIAWGLWHGLGLTFLLWWSRFSAQRKLTFMKTRPGAIVGWAATMGYVSLGGAFAALHGQAPISASFALVAAAFGIVL